MIKHIVMWTLKGQDEGMDSKKNALEMKARLESLKGKIDGLASIEVGLNKNETTFAYDICLITTHASWKDLASYQDHPAHKEVGKFIGTIVQSRAIVDFEN
jgi:hypothetical protein